MTRPILVTSYVDPDLDGTACVIAYAEFLNKGGKKAVAGILGHMHSEVEFVFGKIKSIVPLSLHDTHEYEQIVIVDTSNVAQFEGALIPERVIEVIDHREVSFPEQFPNAKIQIEKVGAAATLIVERFIQTNTEISKDSALLLYGAIASNTFNFQSALTTKRDRDAFSWVKDKSGASDDFVREMFLAKSDLKGERLQKDIQGDYSVPTFNGKTIVIAQLEIIGARKLAREREPEILKELRGIQRERKGDYSFLSIIDLEEKGALFMAEDRETQNLLSRLFNVSFEGSSAWHTGLILRKEMTPKIKKEFEK